MFNFQKIVFKFKSFFLNALILTFVIIFFAKEGHTQGLGNSPYSSLGVGELFPTGYSDSQSMGDVGVASSIGIYVNTLNPALLARNKSTVFSMGMLGQYKDLKTEAKKQNGFSLNLNYLNLAFPVGKKWNMGLAIQPYSYSDFKATSKNTIQNDTSKYVTDFSSKGGINKIAFTNAFEIGKELYFGIETNVLFGQIDRKSISQNQSDSQFYQIIFNEQQNYSGLSVKLGAAWHHKIAKEKYLNFGIAWEPTKSINGDKVKTAQIFDSNGGIVSFQDTLVNSVLTSKVKIGSNLRVGFSYEHQLKYTIYTDFSLNKNSQFKGIDGKNDGLKDGYTIGIGSEFFPSFASAKFLKRTLYKTGLTYSLTPYSNVLNGVQVKDLSFAFGFGLPLRNLSLLNLGFVLGKRGSTSNGGFQENYTKVSIGFTLNDRWFVKQKID